MLLRREKLQHHTRWGMCLLLESAEQTITLDTQKSFILNGR